MTKALKQTADQCEARPAQQKNALAVRFVRQVSNEGFLALEASNAACAVRHDRNRSSKQNDGTGEVVCLCVGVHGYACAVLSVRASKVCLSS